MQRQSMFKVSCFNKITLYKILKVAFVTFTAIIILGIDNVTAREKPEYPKDELRYEESHNSSNSNESANTNKLFKENLKKLENAPFTESQTKINEDQVIGLRFKNGNIIYLSDENTFFSEPLSPDEHFSNTDYFKKFPKLASIEFNKIALKDEIVENVIKFVPKNIMNLVIDSCTFEEKGSELLAELVSRLNDIRALTIRLIDLEPDQVKKIVSAISGLKKLTQLSIAFKNIDPDSWKELSKLFANQKDFKDKYKLKKLEITCGSIEVGEGSLEVLSSLDSLITLNISILSMNGNDSNSLFKVLAYLVNLRDLSLNIGNMREQKEIPLFDNIQDLSFSLEKLTKLINFSIAGLNLSSDCVQLIVQAIGKITSLRSVNLSHNDLDKDVCPKLAEALKELEGLQYLFIRSCNIDSSNFSQLCASISTLSELKALCLGYNKLQGSFKNLILKSMEHLEYLDIANNGIAFDDLITFIKELKDNKSLKVIDVKGNETMYIEGNKEDAILKKDIVEKTRKDNGLNVAIFGM